MSDLYIYNSFSRNKQPFKSIKPNEVKMYVCGITVYDFCHIGHGRVMVAFDIIRRWLQYIGYSVSFVKNITDIDDKIIQRALENKESIYELSNRFIDAMHADAESLNVLKPDHEPRATQYVESMINLIHALKAEDYAYQSDEGDINFAVRKFANYGQLSGKTLCELQAGQRVAVRQSKRDPLDFVLWKKAKPDEPAESIWQAPWGAGRPGWHIECSAMSQAILGEQIDIHGGGQDLQFPHHENEIAQSEAVSKKRFANFWMHNGHVQINNVKMSKSLNNFVRIRDICDKYDGEIVRFFLARAHYRSPINYSYNQLEDAQAALTRLYSSLKPFESLFEPTQFSSDLSASKDTICHIKKSDLSHDYRRQFYQAMNDDFNTPQAIAVLFNLANELNRQPSQTLAKELINLAGILGFLQKSPQSFLQRKRIDNNQIEGHQIENFIKQRIEAKKAKDYSKADKIRSDLIKNGIALEDAPDGQTTWRRI